MILYKVSHNRKISKQCVCVCEAFLTSDNELWKSAVETECRPLIKNETQEVHLE